MKQYKSIEYIMHIYLYTCLKRLTKVRHITIENLVFVTIARSESTGPGGGRNSQSEEKPLKKSKIQQSCNMSKLLHFYKSEHDEKPISTFKTKTRISFFQSQALRRERESRLRQFSWECSRMGFLLVPGLIFSKKAVNFSILWISQGRARKRWS